MLIVKISFFLLFFFFQAEDGIRDFCLSRGLGDVYKRQVIGCGGVASVAIQKCCQADEVFTELCIASRTKEKCDALARKLEGKTKTVITTAKVDADDVNQLIQLINSYKPDLVMNIALPYQDLTIMDACLACGVNYMDTANYCLLYTSPSPRDRQKSRMPSSA